MIGLLEGHFTRLVDYGFTASVEQDLDDIANGERSRVEWLRRFYFGAADAKDAQRISAQGGLKALIADRLERDRRARGELDPDRGFGRRRAGRSLRAVPAAW